MRSIIYTFDTIFVINEYNKKVMKFDEFINKQLYVNRATENDTRKRSLRVPLTSKALSSQRRTFSII
jgi:hypothetical protein